MTYKTALFLAPVSLLLFGAGIDLANLDNYAGQGKPAYITRDNTSPANPITDKGATLGRVLFYDRQLSANNAVSCASCHKQQFAFSDTARLSTGLTGTLTTRHAMRLVNSRFAAEVKFFWDERAASLEDQTSRPIQDHNEMGYSGLNGDPSLSSLISKLSQLPYYNTLFTFVYGDATITEARLQNALAQFIRSIQSFDSKFDAGLAQATNLNASFSNYSALENQGKALFLNPPNQGGAGCQGCHRAPEFDIDPVSKNNGVIASAANPSVIDLTNTRAPSLRDVFNAAGSLNGPLMHNGTFTTIEQLIEHYNLIPLNPANTNLDPKLAGPGGNLQLNAAQKSALIAFLKTLSGTNVYTDPKWADPFDASGNLTGSIMSIASSHLPPAFSLYPNPAENYVQVELAPGDYLVRIVNAKGQVLHSQSITGTQALDLEHSEPGLLFIEITERSTGLTTVRKVIRN